MYIYRDFDASHFLENKDALVGDVLVEYCQGFMNGFHPFGVVERHQLGTVGAHHQHLHVSHL